MDMLDDLNNSMDLTVAIKEQGKNTTIEVAGKIEGVNSYYDSLPHVDVQNTLWDDNTHILGCMNDDDVQKLSLLCLKMVLKAINRFDDDWRFSINYLGSDDDTSQQVEKSFTGLVQDYTVCLFAENFVPSTHFTSLENQKAFDNLRRNADPRDISFLPRKFQWEDDDYSAGSTVMDDESTDFQEGIVPF